MTSKNGGTTTPRSTPFHPTGLGPSQWGFESPRPHKQGLTCG